MKNFKNTLFATLALGATFTSASAATNDFVVQTKKLGAPIQSTMYGIFFEDINFAADGGLYAEMIKKLYCHSRILGGNEIAFFKGFNGSRRKVTQIADWCTHNIKDAHLQFSLYSP